MKQQVKGLPWIVPLCLIPACWASEPVLSENEAKDDSGPANGDYVTPEGDSWIPTDEFSDASNNDTTDTEAGSDTESDASSDTQQDTSTETDSDTCIGFCDGDIAIHEIGDEIPIVGCTTISGDLSIGCEACLDLNDQKGSTT